MRPEHTSHSGQQRCVELPQPTCWQHHLGRCQSTGTTGLAAQSKAIDRGTGLLPDVGGREGGHAHTTSLQRPGEVPQPLYHQHSRHTGRGLLLCHPRQDGVTAATPPGGLLPVLQQRARQMRGRRLPNLCLQNSGSDSVRETREGQQVLLATEQQQRAGIPHLHQQTWQSETAVLCCPGRDLQHDLPEGALS